MRYWGYCMPELLSAAIIDQVKDGLSTDGKVFGIIKYEIETKML